MRLRAIIGNPETGNWETESVIDMVPYAEVFRKKYPGLPAPDSFDDQLAVEDHELELLNEIAVLVTAHYDKARNTISLFVKMNGKSIVQVLGTAFTDNDPGLSVIFNVPGEEFPVEIRVEP